MVEEKRRTRLNSVFEKGSLCVAFAAAATSVGTSLLAAAGVAWGIAVMALLAPTAVDSLRAPA
jgi:hypothetical protein